MTTSYTLGKEERIKSRKAIEKLFAEGKKLSVAPFLVYYLLFNEEKKEPLQFGVGVSGKNFRKAVDRNKIKRLTRESYRLQKSLLKETLLEKKKSLHVFFIYTGKEIPVYADTYPVAGNILQKLRNLVVAK